jgi:Thioredoxin
MEDFFEIVPKQDEGADDEEPFVLVEADEEDFEDDFVLTSKSEGSDDASPRYDTLCEAVNQGEGTGGGSVSFDDVPDPINDDESFKKHGWFFLVLLACYMVVNMLEVVYYFRPPTMKSTHPEPGLLEDIRIEMELKTAQMEKSDSFVESFTDEDDMDLEEYLEIDTMIMHHVDFKKKYGAHPYDAQKQELMHVITSSQPIDVPTPESPWKQEGSNIVQMVGPPNIKPIVTSRVIDNVYIPSRASPWAFEDVAHPIIKPVVVASRLEGAPLPSLGSNWQHEDQDISRNHAVTGGTHYVVSRPVISSVPFPSLSTTAWEGGCHPNHNIAPHHPVQIPVRSLIPFAAPKRSPLRGMFGQRSELVPVPSMGLRDCIPTFNETDSFGSGQSSSTTTVIVSPHGGIPGDTTTVNAKRSLEVLKAFPTLATAWKTTKPVGMTTRKRKAVPGESRLTPFNDKAEADTDRSVTLTQYTFYEYMQLHDTVLVAFYRSGATHQLVFAPIWNNFTSAALTEQLPLITAKVDCHSQPNICRELDVTKSPTVRWFYQGSAVLPDYKGELTVQKLLKHSKKMLRVETAREQNTACLADAGIATAPAKDNAVRDDYKQLPPVAFVKKQRLSRNDELAQQQQVFSSTGRDTKATSMDDGSA